MLLLMLGRGGLHHAGLLRSIVTLVVALSRVEIAYAPCPVLPSVCSLRPVPLWAVAVLSLAMCWP